MDANDPARLLSRIKGHFTDAPPAKLGVAVSGGSDSLGLLSLLRDWSVAGGPSLYVVTVDHHLRAEAHVEAEQVAQLCGKWDLPHTTLHWEHWDGQGNLSDQARRARYRLMAGWAQAHDITHVALGHTADDVAETFLMRLARGAGVDGLAAMAAEKHVDKVTFCRPVLSVTRADLRGVLTQRSLSWAEDPSNEDEKYDRTRARQALAMLGPLGLHAQTLSDVAAHLSEVRQALSIAACTAAERVVRFDAGDVLMRRSEFTKLPPEMTRRLMQAALQMISGAEYGPRGEALQSLLEAVKSGDDRALHGCLIRGDKTDIRITREYSAVAHLVSAPGAIWDNRWRLNGPDHKGAELRALGEDGLKQCPDWRDAGRARVSLLASPSVWSGSDLIAAPLAGFENGWRATQVFNQKNQFAALLSH